MHALRVARLFVHEAEATKKRKKDAEMTGIDALAGAARGPRNLGEAWIGVYLASPQARLSFFLLFRIHISLSFSLSLVAFPRHTRQKTKKKPWLASIRRLLFLALALGAALASHIARVQ